MPEGTRISFPVHVREAIRTSFAAHVPGMLTVLAGIHWFKVHMYPIRTQPYSLRFFLNCI